MNDPKGIHDLDNATVRTSDLCTAWCQTGFDSLVVTSSITKLAGNRFASRHRRTFKDPRQ